MSNLNEKLQGYEQRGIDYDLQACLENNPQGAFDVDDIEKVLAVWEGENDGDDWRWILELKDGRFAYLQGGCDYTGWDCRSSASHEFVKTPKGALACVNDVNFSWKDRNDVVNSLYYQLEGTKKPTWDESMRDEMGNPPTIDPQNINGENNQ